MLWVFQGEDVHLNLHGVAGIKHCINDNNRTMTLIFYVSCVNRQNIIPADRDLEDHTVCEPSNSNDKYVNFYGSVFKWFSDSQAHSDAIKDDVYNWVKKALSQGKKTFLFYWKSSKCITQTST